MGSIDYNTLRQTTLGSGLDEEAVTVNTRALIDKVLARYSGEHTTLRELLQNAADANARTVEIRFETAPPSNTLSAESGSLSLQPFGVNETLKNLRKAKCSRMLVKNDGIPFREEDWQRLKRIAEGNPDETKIGAFGVGFYSVFAECEEPFVSSGSEAMAFYWRGNQLFTRRARLPNNDKFTTFLLEYRTPTEPPPFAALSQFLATSLTFVPLEKIELHIDQYCLCSVTKRNSPSAPLSLPSDVIPQQRGRGAMIKLIGVSTENVQIDAKIMNIVSWKEKSSSASVVGAVGGGLRGFWSHFKAQTSNTPSVGYITPSNAEPAPGDNNSNDLLETQTSTIFIRIATGQLQSNVPQNFANELERATKKPPPKRTTLAILTMSKDELDASDTSSSSAESFVFANILPTRLGKIFIGFPTHQTTGIKAHLSAHSVIPTVERESIDFNARWVRDWNAEMLRMAGILARVCWWHELEGLKRRLLPSTTGEKRTWQYVLPQVSHMMNIFTFVESTPSPVVVQIIEEAFWQCSQTIQVLSTRGILNNDSVRILPSDAEEMSSFLDGIAFLPKELVDSAPGFIKNLVDFRFISEITMSDVKKQLEDRALTGPQVIIFLTWLIRKRLSNDVSAELMKQLLDSAVGVGIENDGNTLDLTKNAPIMLRNVEYYLNPSKIPTDLPLPDDCIPFSLTKKFRREELMSLGWKEMDVVYWVKYLTIPATLKTIDVTKNIILSPTFAAQVFAVLSKQWESISPSAREQIIAILKTLSCMPTVKGMKLPGEAYFHTVKVFKDLPLISPMHGVKDKFLVALGVRKTLELRLVLDRLLSSTENEGNAWSHFELIKYFSSVKEDIPKEDIEMLKKTPFCKADGDDKTLYKVSDLYIPKQDLKDLGCLILQWPGGTSGWRNGTAPEERFLLLLGLRKYPDIQWLLQAMKGSNTSLKQDNAARDRAMNYFVTNHQINGYDKFDLTSTKLTFIPLEKSANDSGTRFGSPSSCFKNLNAKILGFDIIRQDLRLHSPKFGVSDDPSMTVCIERLLKSPPNLENVREMFGYFTSRLSDINYTQVEVLGNARIVPIMQSKALRYLMPRSCFIGGRDSQYKDMFDFVDFGSDANTFLMKIGSKTEPTLSEIAYMLTRDAERLLASCQSPLRYLSILRTVAEGYQDLKKDKILLKAMKKASFLLATSESITSEKLRSPSSPIYHDDDDDQGVREYHLAAAEDVVIVDNFVVYNIFRSDILACPQEEMLETFYVGLGAQGLSKQVREEWAFGRMINDVEHTVRLRDLVLERCRLFFHNNSSSIKRDAKWLDTHLLVQYVDSIQLRRTLQSHLKTHIEKTTAAVIDDATSGKATLYVVKKFVMFDIANQMMKLLLVRPKPHSALLLESLMNTNLYDLRNRGYNVDRILMRKKEKEAKIAEEQKQKMLEAARRRQEDAEREILAQQQAAAVFTQHPENLQAEGAGRSPHSVTAKDHDSEDDVAKIPGAFVDSPDRLQNRLSKQLTKPRGLFSQISRSLGLDKHADTNDNEPSGGQHSLGSVALPTTAGSAPQSVTSPQALNQNLQRAVEASKSFESNSLFSQPETTQVLEQNSYCDARPGKNLTYVTNTSYGIKVYLPKMMSEQECTEFANQHSINMKLFADIIQTLAEVFKLPLKTLHIYCEASPTIAFNRDGALFCNLHYFLELHANQVATGVTADAIVYWFVVLCHELAHNIVKDHSAAHSFYTESFVQQYFMTLFTRVPRQI